jgi:hypothetical protein
LVRNLLNNDKAVKTVNTWIYHFTHKDNLPSILASGSLICDRLCLDDGLASRSIAYSNLKRQRMRTPVEVPPGGTLADYVPFYFGTQSPMLLTYKDGNVTGTRENQDEIIYFATTVEHIVDRQLKYVFTDGHPVKEPKAFFNDVANLDQVDLRLMTQRDWYDTDSDNDRMRRRQAEFLVFQQVPWDDIRAIGVRTAAAQSWVQQSMSRLTYQPRCYIRPSWYYSDEPGR